MDAATELRRYIPLSALEAMLREKRLPLKRVDRFRDPFEGSVPKRQIDDQVPLFSSHYMMGMPAGVLAAHYPGTSIPAHRLRDPWVKMSIRRRAATRSAHASCWTSGPESEGMWRLYCNDGSAGQGVAVSSTLGKVEASVEAHNLYVSPVSYRLYHEGPAFTDEIDPFMHKRLGFRHENEVRLLRYNQAHQVTLAAAEIGDDAFGPAPPSPGELPEHLDLDGWDLLTVADAITVSPYATEDYEQRVRASVAAISADAANLIELSVLSPRRYAAQF